MNCGRLGYITDNSLIQLAPEILERLGLIEGSVIFGLYYPKDPNDPTRANAAVADDFMLTPLLLWDRAAIMVIRLKHGPNNFHKLATFLADQEVSIFFSEFSRSGYRYDTWSLHLAAVGLKAKLTYDGGCSGYKETIAFFKNLESALYTSKQFKDILFADPVEPDLQQPVKLLHLSALSYFSRIQKQKSRKQSRVDADLYEVFEMRVKPNGLIEPEGDAFSRIAKRIEQKYSRSIIGSVVFCEADRRNFNMRIAVFTREMADKVFVVHALYRSDGHHRDFRGLLAGISEKFHSHHTVWKCSNEKHEVQEHSEKGMLKLLIEDQTPDTTPEEKKNRLESHIWAFDRKRFANHTRIQAVKVHFADRAYVEERIAHDIGETKRNRYDVFISYSHRHKREAKALKIRLERKGKLKVWLDQGEMKSGHRFPKRIIGGLMGSQEMILLWSKDAKRSEWIKTEWSVFWFLSNLNANRIINPILIDTEPRELPEVLRELHCTKYAEREALAQLIDDILERAAFMRSY